jgi:hypothetical protein
MLSASVVSCEKKKGSADLLDTVPGQGKLLSRGQGNGGSADQVNVGSVDNVAAVDLDEIFGRKL